MIPPWWSAVVADFDSRVRRLLVGLAQQGFAVNVSSGFRTRAQNRAADGDPFSQHLLGTARDLVPRNGDFATLYRVASASGLFGYVRDESHRAGHGPHIHVQLFRKGQLSPELYVAIAGPELPTPAGVASFASSSSRGFYPLPSNPWRWNL